MMRGLIVAPFLTQRIAHMPYRSFIHSLLCLCAFVLVLLLLNACASTERERDTADLGGDHIHYRTTVTDMSDIMQAKLIHTQAIIEGLALGNLEQVAVNAEVLHEFSLRSSWLVHDTVTYITKSDSFRETVLSLWQAAEHGSSDDAMVAYLAMAQSCLDCHTYLRSERPFLDSPGMRSMLDHLR
jgi:hypothetical protein